jgi:hypothetical protein
VGVGVGARNPASSSAARFSAPGFGVFCTWFWGLGDLGGFSSGIVCVFVCACAFVCVCV